jgi:hypothetical protein
MRYENDKVFLVGRRGRTKESILDGLG